MKIAFVKPPATYANWYRRPLLGIASLASYLEKHGYDCRIFDSVFSQWSEAELMEQIESYGPDLAAFTAMTHEIDAAGRIALRLRQGGTCATVIGGCHFSALPERTLAEFPGFEYGIAGEGEEPLLTLVRTLDGGARPDRSIPGLAFRTEEETTVFNPPAPPLSGEQLDRLPFPAFHLYFGDNPEALAGEGDEYPIISSRGCPYRCAFCMQALGRTVRLRSAERIVEEMRGAISAYGVHTFNFIDEIFLTDTPRTHDLLERMISSGLSRSIRWSGLTRANLVSRKLVEKAARAGCFRLEMGVESGDDRILKKINKGITVAEVREAARLIKQAGIEFHAYFIIGHPGETIDSIARTADLAVELNPSNIAVGIMVPYPGTAIYRMAREGREGYRLLSEDWTRYDKYGVGVLEVSGFTPRQLRKWQRRIMLGFFLKNRRFLDLAGYFWKRRSALWYFLGNRLRGRRT